eukprot:jgi/Tetstr1/434234/TSEL_023345.t1
MRDYERRVFEATVTSSAKATATARVVAAAAGRGRDEDVVVDAGVAAKDAFGSDEVGQRTLNLLSSSLTAQTLESYAGRLSQFAEFCHDSENISPQEATTANVVRVMWGSFNSHLNNVRSQISRVAADVIEQAEELAAPPPPGHPQADGHSEYMRASSALPPASAHRDESPTPPQRTEVVRGRGDSHLSQLKARLQAEKSRAQGQHVDLNKYLHSSGQEGGAHRSLRDAAERAPSATSSRRTTAESTDALPKPHGALANGGGAGGAAGGEAAPGGAAVEVAKLQAHVRHLKQEILQVMQSNEEELERQGGEHRAELERLAHAHRMELGSVTADLEAARRAAAAAKRRAEEGAAATESLRREVDELRAAPAAADGAGAEERAALEGKLAGALARAAGLEEQLAAAAAEGGAAEAAAAREAAARRQLEEAAGQLEAAHAQARELSQVAAAAGQREAELRERLDQVCAAASEAEAQWGRERAELEAAAAQAGRRLEEMGQALAAAQAGAGAERERAAAALDAAAGQRAEAVAALEGRLLAMQREREAALEQQAAAEEERRREVAAAQERAASLEGRARQLQAELEAAEGRAGAGAAVEAELSAARADARGLRRRAEELEVRLGEKEAARVSLAEGLAAEGAARREAAAAAAAHVEELSNELAGLKAALGAASRRAESAERRAAEAEAAMETAAAAAATAASEGAAGAGLSQEAADALRAQLEEATQAAEKASAEKGRALKMLSALKRQIEESEMEEEEKLAWRVDAEVRLALEDYKTSAAAAVAPAAEELRAAMAEAEAERNARRRLEADVGEWAAALEAKDAELANLQLALGELARQAAAETAAAAAEASLAEQQRVQVRLQEGAAALRRALEESAKRMAQLSSDNSTLIDRRIVVQLLVSYFERNYADEVLSVMVRMLGFTEEERSRIAASRRGGVLSRVAKVPFSVLSALAPGGGGGGGDGAPAAAANQGDLAEAWVEFLIKQAEGMAAEDARSGGNGAAPAVGSAENGAPRETAVVDSSSDGPGLVASLGQYQEQRGQAPSGGQQLQPASSAGPATGDQEVWQPQPQSLGLGEAGQGAAEPGGQFTSLSLESPTKPPAWLGA